ncbi:hypothetical protein LCGC14_1002510 [marine sediment metagenome]|uniref:Uncharacterized protein n=1 Tax=marine sediment metagenome TaxID=412755 RepID=A0A0F9R8R9_9ZZZZ
MHSYGGRHGTIFNFNSDFSGDIIITRGDKDFYIPADDILELVAHCYVARNRISVIENMSHKELLE